MDLKTRLRDWRASAAERLRSMGGDALAAAGGCLRVHRGKIPAILGAAVSVVLGWYALSFAAGYQIADDVAFRPAAAAPDKGSRAVAMAAGLVEREVNEVGWVSNDTWLSPLSWSDNMRNYQQGLMSSIGRFTIEMLDQLGRTRGSSQSDPDLEKAAGLFKYAPDVWYINLSTSWLPTAPTETQYMRGVEALRSYNARLAAGKAVYELRGDNLIGVLERIAADLGAASATLDDSSDASNAGWFDTEADDVFYRVKGQMYAYNMLIEALGQDAETVIKDKNLTTVWKQMLGSFREGATLDPLIVANGASDGFLMPNHLSAMGFHLLRARTQLREVISVLMR